MVVITTVIALDAVTAVNLKVTNRNLLIIVGLAIKHLDTQSEASAKNKKSRNCISTLLLIKRDRKT